MKKVLTLLCVGVLCLMPFAGAHAAISVTDVRSVAPQLSSVLASISAGLVQMKAQADAENMALASASQALVSNGMILEKPGHQLSNAELVQIQSSVLSIQAQVSSITQARAARASALQSISAALSGVLSIISQAR